MRNLFYLPLLFFVFFSCTDVRDSSPALQANVENVFFKSSYREAYYFEEEEYFVLQGTENNETITLRGKYLPENQIIEFGGSSENYATFERVNGTLYTTAISGGSGSMIINDLSTSGRYITGDFNFTAILAGQDTITVSRGIFYQVPYEFGVELPQDEGYFVADINGDLFEPSFVSSDVLGPSLTVKGKDDTKEIKITIPADVEAGTYTLPREGFLASYKENGVAEEAVSGNIIVIANFTEDGVINVKFSFLTASNTISMGQFIVNY